MFTTPAIQVYVDERGYYGAASGSFDSTHTLLTYGTDFALMIDQDNGSSRSGILIRLRNFWPKPSVRQGGYLSPYIGQGFGCIKVVYTGGYTVDSLPAPFRMACNLLVSRMRYLFPLGMELSSESYEDRSISLGTPQKDYLLALVKPLLHPYRNWSW